jgi:hypothetical protein
MLVSFVIRSHRNTLKKSLTSIFYAVYNLASTSLKEIKMTDHPAFPPADDRGINMRDYFAAKAMTWFLTALTKEAMLDDPSLLRQFAADHAYKMADAMMKARGE